MSNVLNKVWGIITAIGIGAAFLFYILYDKEKAKKIVSERKLKVNEAETKAKEVAELKNEEDKKNGSVGLATGIADSLDK